jgi:lysophospholipid acyltransferase (LPLAT)-like uncharacterized protein
MRAIESATSRASAHGRAVALYGRATAHAIRGALAVLTRTCSIDASGEPPKPGAPAIFAFWHCNVTPALMLLTGRAQPLVFMAHPAWYVAPWAELGPLMGWDVAMGSTGHSGRRAADEVVHALRRGHCTFVCPDGPTGPARTLRKGVLHMAAESAAPIVPLRFELSRALVLPRWDGGRVPLPFSRVHVTYGAPIRVDPHDLDAHVDALRLAMG